METKDFGDQLARRVVVEWQKGYSDYSAMQPYLEYIVAHYHRYHYSLHHSNQTVVQYIQSRLPEGNQPSQLQISRHTVQQLIEVGVEKSKRFMDYRLAEVYYLWGELKATATETQLLSGGTHQAYQTKYYFKILLKIIYAHIDYIRQFTKLNTELQQHVQQLLQLYHRPFLRAGYSAEAVKESLEDSDRIHVGRKIGINQLNRTHRSPNQLSRSPNQPSRNTLRSNNTLSMSNCSQLQQWQCHLERIETACRQLFSRMVFLNEGEEAKLKQFIRYESKVVSTKNYFLLGLYIGLGGTILIGLLVLVIFNFIYVDQNSKKHDSLDYIFPMFRGVGLLILYLWGMAWNVYGFTTYRINFRVILEFGSHYSSHFEIMKRAGFFTLVFCVMLLLYFLGLSIEAKDPTVQLPIQYTPFVVWVLYFAYIFFPNRQVFNPKGRQYFYGLLKRIFLTPFVKMSFLLSYASDQAVSFVIPIKDFAYTVCYYTSFISDDEDDPRNDYKDCLDSQKIDGIIIAYIVALIPLLIRMLQCYKATNGQFYRHLQMYNFLKYLASVITVSLSFFTSYTSALLIPFVISSVVSTLYSYYWDLKYDWGFLQPNCKHRFLREHLPYHNVALYYTAICINLILRCSWTLTISPSVIRIIPKATFLPFITGLTEIFRRCMWNFFRIEKEHVINCQGFTIIKMSAEEVISKIRGADTQIDPNESMIPYVQMEQEDVFEESFPLVLKEEVEKKKTLFMESLEQEGRIDKPTLKMDFNVKDKYH